MNSITKYNVTKNVVTVLCGSVTATAFFIEPRKLLTARHNVIDALEYGDSVSVIIDGQSVPCSDAYSLGQDGEKIDVAILEISQDTDMSVFEGLKLLASGFKEDFRLHTVGYPEEVGDCMSPIPLDLTFVHHLPNADSDIVLVKNSPVSFFSYRGYSGSPLLNDYGSVVGIIIIQENQNLRAISVKKVVPALEQRNIPYSSNANEEDDSLTGLNRCRKRLEAAIKKAGNKFSPELHQPHTQLLEDFSKFLDIKCQVEYEQLLKALENWCIEHPTFKDYKFGEGDSETVEGYLASIEYTQLDYNETIEVKELKKEAKERIRLLYKMRQLSNESRPAVFGIFGPAGVGKSHMSCWLARYSLNLQHHNVYYNFGTEFSSDSTAVAQLLKLNGFDEDSALTLSTETASRNAMVLFVIDAINEGPGFRYWEDNLPDILKFFDQYKNFKLLLTGRRTGSKIYELLEWNRSIGTGKTKTFELDGFENLESAVDAYCLYYNLDSSWVYSLGIDLSNPLMLSLFCKTRRAYDKRNKPNRIQIFSDYITRRNVVISEKTDVDPALNVSLKALCSIAQSSAFQEALDAVPRQKAQEICNSLCPSREWSRNLLHHLISENLLFEIREDAPYENQLVDFEFQNIGDVLRAKAFIEADIPFSDIVTIYEKRGKGLEYLSDNFKNAIIATLGLWKKDDIDINTIERLHISIIEDALWYGGKINKTIEEYFRNHFDTITIPKFFSNQSVLSVSLILDYHKYLVSLNQSERDWRNIKEINRKYDINQRYIAQQLSSIIESDEKSAFKKILYLGWLCSSSYPDFRAILVRQLAITLKRHPSLCASIIEAFAEVDDAYVVSGVLCGVYGTVLTARGSVPIDKIALVIYNYFYSSSDKYPINLHVRLWSWQILDFAKSMNPESDYVDKIKLPFENTSNPFEWEIDNDNIEPNTVFGKTEGGKRLQYNVFRAGQSLPSDFNRYIIGTNSSQYDHYFLFPDRERIPLDTIEKLIANEILRLGWNDELGKIDTGPGPSGRNDNRIERIGKKYLWIAYQNVVALLMDHGKFKTGEMRWYGKDSPEIDNAEPWMHRAADCFDPTLNIVNTPMSEIPNLQFKFEISDYTHAYENSEFPQAIFIQEDNKGITWVQIDAWDNWTDSSRDNPYAENFYNQHVAWFCKGVGKEVLAKFLAEDNGFDPHMPIDSLYECLWNELPWSRRSNEWRYEWLDISDIGCKIMPARVTQLQEEIMGLEFEDIRLNNASTMNWEFMETQNLYNAERGIIRDSASNTIIGYNRGLLEDGCGGLIIRKDILDSYLNSTGQTLIVRIEHYKGGGAAESLRKYEWFIYDQSDGFDKINP